MSKEPELKARDKVVVRMTRELSLIHIIGQNVVSGAAGVIHGNTSIDIDATIAQMRTGMENMGVGELLLSLIHI